jgi:hypothetical protein
MNNIRWASNIGHQLFDKVTITIGPLTIYRCNKCHTQIKKPKQDWHCHQYNQETNDLCDSTEYYQHKETIEDTYNKEYMQLWDELSKTSNPKDPKDPKVIQ